MKKNTAKHAHQMEEDLRPEYDFSEAVRGKITHFMKAIRSTFIKRMAQQKCNR